MDVTNKLTGRDGQQFYTNDDPTSPDFHTEHQRWNDEDAYHENGQQVRFSAEELKAGGLFTDAQVDVLGFIDCTQENVASLASIDGDSDLEDSDVDALHRTIVRLAVQHDLPTSELMNLRAADFGLSLDQVLMMSRQEVFTAQQANGALSGNGDSAFWKWDAAADFEGSATQAYYVCDTDSGDVRKNYHTEEGIIGCDLLGLDGTWTRYQRTAEGFEPIGTASGNQIPDWMKPTALQRRDLPLSQEEVSTRLQQGESLAGANLSGLDLRGVDLTTTDLSNANLDGADLTEAILSREINNPSWAEAHPIVGYVEQAEIVHYDQGDNEWSECVLSGELIRVGVDGQYYQGEEPIGSMPPAGMKPFDEETGEEIYGDKYRFEDFGRRRIVDGFEVRSRTSERQTYYAVDTTARLFHDQDPPTYRLKLETKVDLGGSPMINGFDPDATIADQLPDSAFYVRESVNLTGASMVQTITHGLELDGITLEAVAPSATIVDPPLARLTLDEVRTKLANGDRDLSYVDLSGIDFRQAPDISFAGCTLTGSSLANTNLSQTNMEESACNYVDFSGATLSRLSAVPGAGAGSEYERWQATHPVVGYVERTRVQHHGDDDDTTYLERMPVRIDVDGFYHFDTFKDHRNASHEQGSGTNYRNPASRTPPEGFVPLDGVSGGPDGDGYRFRPRRYSLADLGSVFLVQKSGDNEDRVEYKSDAALAFGIEQHQRHRLHLPGQKVSGRAYRREMVHPGGRDSYPTYKYIPLTYRAEGGKVTFVAEPPPPLKNIGQSPLINGFDPARPLSEQLPDALYLKSESVTMTNASLVGCDLRDVEASGLQLQNTFLSDVDLSGANLRYATFESVVAAKIGLNEAHLENTTMRNATFLGGTMLGAKAHQLTARNCSFIDVDMRGIDLSDGRLYGEFFEGCNVKEANFHDMRAPYGNIVSGCDFESAHFDRSFSCRHVLGCRPPEKSWFEKWMPEIIKAATTIAFSKVPVVGWVLGPLVSSITQNNGFKGDFLKDWALGVVTHVALNGIKTGDGHVGGWSGAGNQAAKVLGEHLGANPEALSNGLSLGSELADVAVHATKVVADTIVSELIKEGDLSDVGIESIIELAGKFAYATAHEGMAELGLEETAQYAVASSVRYIVEQEVGKLGGLEAYDVSSLASFIVNTISKSFQSLLESNQKKNELERAAAVLGFGSVDALEAWCDGDLPLENALAVARGEMTPEVWNRHHLLTTEPWESLPEGLSSRDWASLQSGGCNQGEVNWALNNGIETGVLVSWIDEGYSVGQLVVADRLMNDPDRTFFGWQAIDGLVILQGTDQNVLIKSDGRTQVVLSDEAGTGEVDLFGDLNALYSTVAKPLPPSVVTFLESVTEAIDLDTELFGPPAFSPDFPEQGDTIRVHLPDSAGLGTYTFVGWHPQTGEQIWMTTRHVMEETWDETGQRNFKESEDFTTFVYLSPQSTIVTAGADDYGYKLAKPSSRQPGVDTHFRHPDPEMEGRFAAFTVDPLTLIEEIAAFLPESPNGVTSFDVTDYFANQAILEIRGEQLVDGDSGTEVMDEQGNSIIVHQVINLPNGQQYALGSYLPSTEKNQYFGRPYGEYAPFNHDQQLADNPTAHGFTYAPIDSLEDLASLGQLVPECPPEFIQADIRNIRVVLPEQGGVYLENELGWRWNPEQPNFVLTPIDRLSPDELTYEMVHVGDFEGVDVADRFWTWIVSTRLGGSFADFLAAHEQTAMAIASGAETVARAAANATALITTGSPAAAALAEFVVALVIKANQPGADLTEQDLKSLATECLISGVASKAGLLTGGQLSTLVKGKMLNQTLADIIVAGGAGSVQGGAAEFLNQLTSGSFDLARLASATGCSGISGLGGLKIANGEVANLLSAVGISQAGGFLQLLIDKGFDTSKLTAEEVARTLGGALVELSVGVKSLEIHNGDETIRMRLDGSDLDGYSYRFARGREYDGVACQRDLWIQDLGDVAKDYGLSGNKVCGLIEDLFKRKGIDFTRDPILQDFQPAAARIPTLRRMMKYLSENEGYSGVHVEWDIANVDGMNAYLNHNNTDKVLSRISEIVNEELGQLPVDFHNTRRGGDEGATSILGVDIDTENMSAAFDRIQYRIDTEVNTMKLEVEIRDAQGNLLKTEIRSPGEAPHPKHKGEDAFDGTGLYFGMTEVPGAADTSSPAANRMIDDLLAPCEVTVEDLKKVRTPIENADLPDLSDLPADHQTFDDQFTAWKNEAMAEAAEAGLGPQTESVRDVLDYIESNNINIAFDPVSGCLPRVALDPSFNRAIAHARDTGSDLLVWGADIVNQNGVNAALGQSRADVYIKGVLDIVREELGPVTHSADVFRAGGDEYYAIIEPDPSSPNAIATIQEANARIVARVEDLADSMGLSDIPHTKNDTYRGTSLYMALDTISGHDTPKSVTTGVDAVIEGMKRDAGFKTN